MRKDSGGILLKKYNTTLATIATTAYCFD